MGCGDVEDELVPVIHERIALLRALTAPREKPELVEVLGWSRSTVDRALRELALLDLVAREDGYRLTATGRLVVDAFDGFADGLSSVGEARDLLATLPPDAPMDGAMLRGARVEPAGSPSPTRALDPVLAAFREAERVRGLSMGATRPGRVADLVEDRLSDGTAFEMVFDEAMVGFLRSEFPQWPDAVFAEEDFEAYVRPSVPYGLGVVDTPTGQRAFVVVYDDRSTIRGVIVNDTPRACGWAVDVFERYRDDADPLAEA